MILNFDELERKKIPAFKGGDGCFEPKLFSDSEGCKFMQGHLEPGASIGYHKHEEDCEVVFVLSGEGSVLYEGEEFPLKANQCHYCPRGCSHSLRGGGEKGLDFYACVITK